MAISNPINANIQQPEVKTDPFKSTHIETRTRKDKNGKNESYKVTVADDGRETWGIINDQHWNLLTKGNSNHKSLDFSNVNVYGENNLGGYKAGDDYDMRRFHQMVIYTGYGPEHTIITSNLPERIQYSLDSVWQEPLSFNNALTNLFFQAQAGASGNEKIPSGINRAGTIRIWGGTQPLKMQVTIPVLDDNQHGSGTNLVEALDELGKLCLPKYVADGYGFYMPPPSPLSLTVKYSSAWLETKKEKETKKPETKTLHVNNPNYKHIMIQLGGILLIDKCVIEGISVDYPDTKTMIQHDYVGYNKVADKSSGEKFLHPLLANVTIKFSTVEAMTSNRYNEMLWAKQQRADFIGDFTIAQNNSYNGQPTDEAQADTASQQNSNSQENTNP